MGSANVFEEFYRIAKLFENIAAILGRADMDHGAVSDCTATDTYGAVHTKLEAYLLAHTIFRSIPAAMETAAFFDG